MLQTQVSSPETPTPDRRIAPSRHTPPIMVVELASADDFRSLARRHSLRSKRDRHGLVALALQARFEPDPDIAPDHAARLQLLADCAGRLRGRVRATDIVARWQGGSFGVLLPRCNSAQAEAVLARLVRFSGCSGLLRGVPMHLRLQGRVLGDKDV